MQNKAARPSVGIQTVLYNNSTADVARWLAAVHRTAADALKNGLVENVAVMIGDCSTDPIIRAAGDPDGSHLSDFDGQSNTTYIHFGANLGHSGGQNRLAGDSESDLIFFVNPDAICAPDALGRLVQTMSAGCEDIGAVEARQVPLEHPKTFDTETGEVAWVAGAATLVLRRAFDAIGGFDSESFPMYCDDVDLSWRLRLAGFRLLYCPEALVFHDKRLDADGNYVPTAIEERSSAEAALTLMHKYSRPGSVAEFREFYLGLREPYQLGVRDYDQRRDQGQLPEPIDQAHLIEHPVGPSQWTIHRT